MLKFLIVKDFHSGYPVNEEGKLVGEGMCHSVKSDLVVGANGPLGDSHVAIHICRSHSE